MIGDACEAQVAYDRRIEVGTRRGGGRQESVNAGGVIGGGIGIGHVEGGDVKRR